MAKEKSKKKDKASKEGKKSKKGSGELTGLAKYRAEQAALKAKGGGKTKGKAKAKADGAKKKNGLPVIKAPKDFKPHFLEVTFRTEKDGLLGGAIKATRYQGRYDPQAEDKKKADLGSYDPTTLGGILARLAAMTFATNAAKRLEANTVYRALMRINKKSADGSIAVSIKTVWKAVKSEKTGRIKAEELEKSDPICRKIRRAGRLLPPAFKDVQMPPKRTRSGKKKKKEDSDDE